MLPNLYVIGGITAAMADALSPCFTLCYDRDLADDAAWFEREGSSVHYILTNGHDGVPKKILDALPAVKLISNYGVGYDAIDVEDAAKRGIIVTHTPDVLNDEVATTALLLMISCFREFRQNEAHARSGAWEVEGNAPLSRSADNRKIGIVGLGRIGQAIADKLAPFGSEILYHSRTAKNVSYRYYDNLIDMATDSDALIVITPGGPSTHKLINADVLEALGPEGVLVNVSRGSVVDEQALIHALEQNIIASAGLDVFEGEPHIPEALRMMDNVVLLPHVGSATHETRAAMGQLVVDNLLQHHTSGQVFTPVPETAHFADKIER